MPFIVKKTVKTANSYLHENSPSVQTMIEGYQHFKGGTIMTKKTKKDGGTKQKGKGSKGNKTSGSANGSNGYH
jgi:hypothetical protein